MFKLIALAVTSATATLRNGDVCSSNNDCATSCCALNQEVEQKFLLAASEVEYSPEATFDATTGRFLIDYENMVCQSSSSMCAKSSVRFL